MGDPGNIDIRDYADEDIEEGLGTVTAVDAETTEEAAEQLKKFKEKSNG